MLGFGFHGLSRAFGVFPVNGVVLLSVATAFTALLVMQRVFTGVLQPLLLRTDVLHNVLILHIKLQVTTQLYRYPRSSLPLFVRCSPFPAPMWW